MHIYEKVRTYMERSGATAAAVARAAGIPCAVLEEILNGKRRMYADELRAICLALNVSPEMFIAL